MLLILNLHTEFQLIPNTLIYSNFLVGLSHSLGVMKHRPRNMNFGIGTLWRSFRVSFRILYLRKRWFMYLRRNSIVMGDVSTLKCTVATGGGELRYLIIFLLDT